MRVDARRGAALPNATCSLTGCATTSLTHCVRGVRCEAMIRAQSPTRGAPCVGAETAPLRRGGGGSWFGPAEASDEIAKPLAQVFWIFPGYRVAIPYIEVQVLHVVLATCVDHVYA